jgi:hypothetical protein
VLAAQEQRAKLHLRAAGLCNSDGRHATFAQMSQLLLEAFEEICLVSEALWEDSQALRSHAEEVCECFSANPRPPLKLRRAILSVGCSVA